LNSELLQGFTLDDWLVDPRIVQTLPKRGYRLTVTPVFGEQSTSPVPEPEPIKTHGWWDLLLRHGVIQAAAAYLAVGWLLIQIADTTFAKIGLPVWSEHFVTFMVIGGFPLLVLLAWFLESVGGRMEHDSGNQSGGLFHGLERNYFAMVLAKTSLTVSREYLACLSRRAAIPGHCRKTRHPSSSSPISSLPWILKPWTQASC